MQPHATGTDSKYAQNATTASRKVHTVAELRMALEDKARGQRIAALRKQRRLTQQVMAERLGIAYRTYQTWEAGMVVPEWPNLEKLAAFFGIKPEDIIGESPDVGALLGLEPPDQAQLDRIEEKVDQVLAELAAIRLDLARPSRQGTRPQKQSQREKEASGS